MTLQTKIEQALALAEAACPGPWRVNSVSDGIGRSVVTNQSHPLCELSSAYHRQCSHGTGRDAEFIAASRSLVPALAKALQFALKGLWHYSGEQMRIGSTITPIHADKALAEITKILLPEEKV